MHLDDPSLRHLIIGGPPMNSIPTSSARRRDSPVSKLDPVAKFLWAHLSGEKGGRDVELHVLVWVSDVDREGLARGGLRLTSIADDIVAGFVRAADIIELANVKTVRAIEGPRPLRPQLDESVPEIFGLGLRSSFGTGGGAAVGVIDTGIWFTHFAFRDDRGKTRLLALWDQQPVAKGAEKQPTLVKATSGLASVRQYGVKYVGVDIDGQIAKGAWPPLEVHHVPASDHGSKVASIAAGNGRVGVGPAGVGSYVGVAPDAALVVASAPKWPSVLPVNPAHEESFIASPAMFDAANFLLAEAIEAELPIAINISHGDNFGPHDGSSLLERGLTRIGTRKGCVVVVAAGNSYGDRRHAVDDVHPGTDFDLEIYVSRGIEHVDYIDIWYPAGAALDLTLVAPDGRASTRFRPTDGEDWPDFAKIDADTLGAVESVKASPLNGDARITVALRRQERFVSNGVWRFRLRTTGATPVPFHAWIGGPSAVFVRPSPSYTVITPGCAPSLVTVGAYRTKKNGPHGALLNGSASGPTRREKPKPDVCAPGQGIAGAWWDESGAPALDYELYGDAGTSFAAPHVAGVVALMLARDPDLTVHEVLCALRNTARPPGATAVVVDPYRWGGGMLDAAAALKAVAARSKPVVHLSPPPNPDHAHP